jgi:hypothetical protein
MKPYYSFKRPVREAAMRTMTVEDLI